MDNEEDLKQQSAESLYIENNAKYKQGDVVGFISLTGTIIIGVIIDVSFRYVKYTNSNTRFTVITYTIVTPIYRTIKDECDIFNLTDYIYRQYCNQLTL